MAHSVTRDNISHLVSNLVSNVITVNNYDDVVDNIYDLSINIAQNAVNYAYSDIYGNMVYNNILFWFEINMYLAFGHQPRISCSSNFDEFIFKVNALVDLDNNVYYDLANLIFRETMYEGANVHTDVFTTIKNFYVKAYDAGYNESFISKQLLYLNSAEHIVLSQLQINEYTKQTPIMAMAEECCLGKFFELMSKNQNMYDDDAYKKYIFYSIKSGIYEFMPLLKYCKTDVGMLDTFCSVVNEIGEKDHAVIISIIESDLSKADNLYELYKKISNNEFAMLYVNALLRFDKMHYINKINSKHINMYVMAKEMRKIHQYIYNKKK